MLCQNCNKEQATRHYKQVINGESRELHLCGECAEKMGYASFGYNPMFSADKQDFGFGLDNLLSHMLGGKAAVKKRSTACPLCGATAEDISRSGRVGCAKCYEQFSDMLTPYIRRIHGNTMHAGRMPENIGGEITARRKLEGLKTELKRAIELQEFERAAELRDEIKELENGN